jgi:hypothetical protein
VRGIGATETLNGEGKHATMHDLSRHPYFERWRDPGSGIVSYLLKERVAPIQQTFYFTNSSVSRDEDWLWFYAGFPPNRQQMLGCVSLDPDRPSIRLFPQAGFSTRSPMVAPEGDAASFSPSPARRVLANAPSICAISSGVSS